VKFNSDVIKNDEKAIFALRSLYLKYGYKRYKMSKFEEYDLYARNKDFLVSDSVITFTDTNGRLMALKPDVTLSIIKNSSDDGLTKVYYNENVYRVSQGSTGFKEIMQTGLECIGDIDTYNICEVVMLAAKSLMAISEDFALDISHMGFISELLDSLNIESGLKKRIVSLMADKNLHEIKQICKENDIPSENIELVASTYGNGDEVLKKLEKAAVTDEMKAQLSQLKILNEFLKNHVPAGRINFDFSIVNDMNYYSAIVFKGYIKGIETGVLSGGQYGSLMNRMGKKSDAIGFAVYLDMLERLSAPSKKYDTDIVILYDDDADVSELAKNIKMLSDNGSSVLALKKRGDIRCKQLLKFNGKGVEILENND